MGRIALLVKGVEDVPRGKPAAGLDDDHGEEPPAGEILHLFPDAPGAGQAAPKTERDVRAQLKTQRLQFRGGEPGAPEPVQAVQHRGRVRAAAAEPGADRNPLIDGDPRAGGVPGVLLQQTGGPQGQMALVCLQEGRSVGDKGQIRRGEEGDRIRERDGLHEHVHQVISVLPQTRDIQGPVDFGMGFQLHRYFLF